MNSLLCGCCYRRNARGCFRQRLANAVARGSSNYIVAIEGGIQRNGLEEVDVKLAAKPAKFVERQFTQFHALCQRKSNCVADLLMRRTEGNALVHKVGGRGHRVQVA